MFDSPRMNQRSELVALAAVLAFIGGAALRAADAGPRALVQGLAGVGVLLTAVSLWMWWREQSASSATREISRRYMREFFPALALYVLAVAGSVALLRRVDEPGLRALVALLPSLPIGWFLRATARYIRALDELQRRIELEALALGSVFLAFAYLTAGLLQSAGLLRLDASLPLLFAFPVLAVAYGVAKRFVARHYA